MRHVLGHLALRQVRRDGGAHLLVHVAAEPVPGSPLVNQGEPDGVATFDVAFAAAAIGLGCSLCRRGYRRRDQQCVTNDKGVTSDKCV